ncbi:hypothetical protein NG2371_02863 [Nocardia gamkensis]|nr:hypothetical protein [Nocardia gamkensis]
MATPTHGGKSLREFAVQLRQELGEVVHFLAAVHRIGCVRPAQPEVRTLIEATAHTVEARLS